MLTLRPLSSIVIMFVLLSFSATAIKKSKSGNKRHYQDLEEKYNRLQQRQEEQAAQLYKVIDGLRSLCQNIEASPWDPELTNEPYITDSFTEATTSPTTTKQSAHGLRPLSCSIQQDKQRLRYEVNYQAESKPYIFWQREDDLIIRDDHRNDIVSDFRNFTGTSVLVSVEKSVQVNIILGPLKYTVRLDSVQNATSHTEMSLMPIGINLGQSRRREFIPGTIIEFTAEIPKSYSDTEQQVTPSGVFVVMGKRYASTAKEFRVWGTEDTSPFVVEEEESEDLHKAVFKLDTGKYRMEGLLTVEAVVRLTNESEPQVILTESQSIIFYQTNRKRPYPNNIASFVDHNDYKTQPCQEGKACSIKCKAFGNFLGEIYITRKADPPETVSVQSHQLNLWGGVHEAVFTIENFREKNAGIYTCSGRSQYKSAVTQDVHVPFFKQARIMNGSGTVMQNERKLIFKCIASGYPLVDIVLYKNSNVTDIFTNSDTTDITTKLVDSLRSVTLVVDKTRHSEQVVSVGCIASHAYHSTSIEVDVTN